MSTSRSSAAARDPAWWHVRPAPALLLLALFLAVTVVQGWGRHAAEVDAGAQSLLSHVLHQQILGAIAVWASLPIVMGAIHVAPDGSRGWGRFALVHVASTFLFGASQTVLMLVFDTITASWLGHAFDVTHLVAIARDELRGALLLYPALGGLMALVRAQRERARHAARQAALEQALVQARLDALAARLDPHFFFNTLNTISVLMYEDLGRAETLVADLGALLRSGLETTGPTWPVDDEIAYTRRYVDVLRARFEDRLEVRFEIDVARADLLVPRFSIQSLVENAVKHNETRARPLEIVVGVKARADALAVRVQDDGAGLGSADPLQAGRGLTRLRDVLALLHGDRATLTVASSPRGGALVAWEVRTP